MTEIPFRAQREVGAERRGDRYSPRAPTAGAFLAHVRAKLEAAALAITRLANGYSEVAQYES
jgi:hypothetical protein